MFPSWQWGISIWRDCGHSTAILSVRVQNKQVLMMMDCGCCKCWARTNMPLQLLTNKDVKWCVNVTRIMLNAYLINNGNARQNVFLCWHNKYDHHVIKVFDVGNLDFVWRVGQACFNEISPRMSRHFIPSCELNWNLALWVLYLRTKQRPI